MGKSFTSTFKYDCELHFNDKDGNSTEIIKETIKYIIVSHDYKTKIMPVIYIKANIRPSVYNKMVPQQGTAKLVLTLTSLRDSGSTSSVAKNVIHDEFDYFMTDDPNAYRPLDEIGEDNGTSYKVCTIGLIKSGLTQQNKKSFEGIYKNTNTLSLIQSATSGMNMVIQPFTNNTEIESFTCPAVGSVGQFINYINSMYSFYSGGYTYYMDFDKTYLISNDGSYIDIKDNDFRYIAFDVQDLTQYAALTTGIVEDQDQDAYIIYVNANDAQISTDRVTPDLNGLIKSVNTSTTDTNTTDVSIVDTSAITNINANMDAITIIPSNDPNAANNTATKIAENSVILTITKTDMNSKIFTPNKQYMLSYYYDNPSYCGLYYLVNKTEIYLNTGTNIKCQMTIQLRKCADFVSTPEVLKNRYEAKVQDKESTTGTKDGNNDV